MADSVQWFSQLDYSICIIEYTSRILLKLNRNIELTQAFDVMMA